MLGTRGGIDRDHRQVDKSNKIMIESRSKRPWTVEEDNLMRDVISKHGCGNWSQISQHFVDRSGKQCRERWHNHLNPGIKKGDWTDLEDRIIASLQRLWGNQWAKITTLLPGRTDNAVKNRYHATIRSKLKKGIQFLTESEIYMISQNIAEVEECDYDDDKEGFNLNEKYNISNQSNKNVFVEATIIPKEIEISDTSEADDMTIPNSPVSDSIESIDMSAVNVTPYDLDWTNVDWITDDSPSDPLSDEFEMDYVDYDDEDSSDTKSNKQNDSKCFSTNWTSSDINAQSHWYNNFSANICQERMQSYYEKENSFCGLSYLNRR